MILEALNELIEKKDNWIETDPSEKGKYEGKNIGDLEKMKADLLADNDKYQAKGEKVPKENIEKMAEINFALRAKRHELD